MRRSAASGPLNDRQLQAVVLLYSGVQPNEVMSQLGIDRTTWWRWSQLPHFMAALRSVVDASLTTAAAFFSTKLVGVLAQLLKEVREAPTPRDRIRAAEVYVNVLHRVQAMGQDDLKALGRTISLVYSESSKALPPPDDESSGLEARHEVQPP